MSDFTSDFWSYYVIVLTIGSIFYCGWLLWRMSKVKVASGAAPAGKGGQPQLTGHTWDEDLAEYNNPLPRWWMWLFWITIVFAVVYLALYPGLGKVGGLFGWSSAEAYQQERSEVEARTKPIFDRYLAMDLKQVAADPQARAMGERLFLNYCAQCHGSAATGARGIPNLTHKELIYGVEPEQIKTTITKGRLGIMPALGPVIGPENVKNVVAYVRSLSGLPHDSLRAQLGKPVFAGNCVGCHGAEAKGNKFIGAPNLTDANWLYGSSEATITETVMKGRHVGLPPGSLAMPAWHDRLGEGRIHVLAAYVWGLATHNGTN